MMKYGLIGKTLVHSYSKEIHEALGKYTYELFSLTEEAMPEFVNARDFGGLNVTIPYKKAVMPLCDEISQLASDIGAVNTLYWLAPTPGNSRPRLAGHNTDYEGFLYAAKRADINFSGRNVLILGTGGTSLTASKAASDSGASHIYIASRSAAAVKQDSRTANDGHLHGSSASLACPVRQLTYGELAGIAADIDVIVNTTPVGTYPNNLQSIITLADFPGCNAVMDVIYNPFKTRLLLEAEKAGLKHSNGLPMLVAQATAAAGYFLDSPGAFEKENERIILQLEKQMRNIVLIGMPGSGKSTIGKLLSAQTRKTFVDMDQEIEKNEGLSIPEIFSSFGENYFRAKESETAEKLGKERGLIIATGGGTILNPANVDALRQNGLIIHIKRPVDCLSTNGRPLSKDKETLYKMENERLPIYTAAADIVFDNSIPCSEEQLAKRLEEELKL